MLKALLLLMSRSLCRFADGNIENGSRPEVRRQGAQSAQTRLAVQADPHPHRETVTPVDGGLL